MQPDAAYSVGNPPSATVTILEEDFTSVTIYPTALATKPSGSGSFTLKRDGDLTGNLAVFYTVGGTAAPGLDYVPLPNSIMIPAGEASTEIVVSPKHDGV